MCNVATSVTTKITTSIKKKKKKIEKLTQNNNTFTSEPAQILFLLCIGLNNFSF